MAELKIKENKTMALLGIGQNHYQNNMLTTNRSTNYNKVDFAENIGKASPYGTQKVTINKEALFSICHAPTGETANIYRADEYSADNPFYIVKGIDQNGNKYEQIVDVRKINPNNCSYTEMLVLNVHTGHTLGSDFLKMARIKEKAGNSSYTEKLDYMQIARVLMNEMKMVRCQKDYLSYDKWLRDILDL